MAFTTPYSYRGLPEVPAAYVKIDYASGNSHNGWDGTFRIYADRETRMEDIGDDLLGASFTKHVEYVAGADPIKQLYVVAKNDFPDAQDA